MPGSISEVIFANSSGALASGVLTVTQGTVTLTGKSGITVTGSGSAYTVAHAHTCVGGSGLTLAKSGGIHIFDTSLPLTTIRIAGTAYAAGTLDEISFPDATRTQSGQHLQITTSGSGGSSSVASANGIYVSQRGSVYTVNNTKQAPNIRLDCAAQSLPTTIDYVGFANDTASGVLTLTAPAAYTAGVGVSLDSDNVITNVGIRSAQVNGNP